MDPSKVRPLETLHFGFRPLAPLAVAWSCDAELAVALDDAIHVLLPEYPREGRGGDGAGDGEAAQPQFSLSLQVSGIIRPEPGINAQLCAVGGALATAAAAAAGASADDDFCFDGVGRGAVTGRGAALGQTVRVEWSPGGLGLNLRPVLTALATNGCLVALGEHGDRASTTEAAAFGATTRSFGRWCVLWGLGARLPVPVPGGGGGDGDGDDGPLARAVDDKIVAFSWARDLGLPGRALLAYADDAGAVAVVAVQLVARAADAEPAWRVQEVARFDGRGPHEAADPYDAHDTPAPGGASSLRWSPWHGAPGAQTAVLAYLAHHHVGFRRVDLAGAWERGRDPALRVAPADMTSFCIHLGPNAFVEWEDATWADDGRGPTARGIIATPFAPKPFQVDLCAGAGPRASRHPTAQCATTYPRDEDASTNPITGLVIHPPDRRAKPPTPRYSLVRLSATGTNGDWFQTNAPARRLPQWATYVRAQAARAVPRLAAMHGVDSDSDSDDLELEDPVDDDDDDDDDSDDADADIARRRPSTRVRPFRFRFWGLAASPAGTCSAVLVTRHSTRHPHRRALSSLLFARPVADDDEDDDDDDDDTGAAAGPPPPRLSTEARLWEAVYGRRGSVADVVAAAAAPAPSPLRRLFRDAVARQRCVFCDAPLRRARDQSTCKNGHVFATCAASGLAIVAPGVSRLCAVCGLRCLQVGELAALARRLVAPDARVDSAGDACGACGGKFVA